MLRSLLQRVPQEQRIEAIAAAVHSVGDNGTLDVSLTISLVEEISDHATRQALLARLLGLLELGRTDLVLAVCAHHADIRRDLLQCAAQRVYDLAGWLHSSSGKGISAPLNDIVPVGNSNSDVDSSRNRSQNSDVSTAIHLLILAKTAVSADVEQDTFDRLFKAALFLLASANSTICVGARETLGRLFEASKHMSHAHHQLLWTCLQQFAHGESDAFHQGLAFAIWLRWVHCEHAELQVWFEPDYWALLRNGLKYGDAERRKQCLAILRRSVAIAASDDSSIATICANQDGIEDHQVLLVHYERYCTVFETILLGRYLNQVLECEFDLNHLASPESLVKSEWLYTLLVSALHPKIQGSNRKFIGNWIMRSCFQPDISKDFVEFLCSAFLPWATQGSLFTATLRTETGRLQCGHGDRLVEYVRQLIQRNVSDAALNCQLVNAVLDVFLARRSSSFAYAIVYLLEGLSRAFEGAPTMKLDLRQLQKISDLSSWAALPEVARDYVFVRCLKLCGDSLFKATEDLQSESVVKAITRWNQLQAILSQPARTEFPAGSIASWEAEPSNRDIREEAALHVCRKFQDELLVRTSLEAMDIEATLLEIWTDLEYLEYPKGFVMTLPGLLLNPKLVVLACDSERLARTIRDMVHKLQALSANRVYLMSPLLCAIRNAVVVVPIAADWLHVAELVMRYAEHLPEPTVDLQLEEATTQLLQSVAPGLRVFDYEYYFGPHETLGAAALLDVISRLGESHRDTLKAVLDELLNQWMKQRNPPPTVSPWKSTLQLQVMLLCCEQVLAHYDIEHLLKQLHYVLSIEPLPRYRYLLGRIIARIYLKNETLGARILGELATKDHHSNPKYLASLMKIGVMLAQTESATVEFGLELVSAFVPLAASSKVIIRHEAQWQVPLLMDVAKARDWTEIPENVAFAALDDYIRSLERFERPPPERQLDRFDPVKDHTLTNLVEGPWYGLDNTEAPICRRADFVKLYDRDTRLDDASRRWSAPCMPLGDPIPPVNEVAAAANAIADIKLVDESKEALAPSKAGESRALQTKGAAYIASALLADAAKHARHNELIIIASLVDNPYNLGGLSRVSEVFGASEMHLQNQNVTFNKDFQAVAVSSHLHLPLLQLSASAVPSYLSTKRNEGWSIVGIEQTDRSMLLGSEDCKLPKKVVLVTGSEKEGIPALVLSECDLLVEIPQRGVTRSLNVQTAAAIVLYESARQHRAAPEEKL